MSFYDILGVSNDASESEIKKAYRKLSLEWHPDRNSSPEAKEKYQKINEAYDTLSDATQRKEYDMKQMFGGEEGGIHFDPFGGGGHPFGGGGNPFGGMSEFFDMMFHGGGGGGMPGAGGMPGGFGGIHIVHNGVPLNMGGGGGGPFHFNMQKPAPIVKNINISLQQAYNGCSITIPIERWVIENGNKRNESETLQIEIPPGADGGENVAIRDRGNRQNGICGDIKLCINVDNHPEFKRNGLDLIYSKKVSLKEALCGLTFEIRHLNDKVLNLASSVRTNIIKPNDKKVVPHLGMRRGDQVGNLIIDFEVEFPDNLTEEQINHLSLIL
jgi:DnaJ-class molecular chaperone